MRGRRSVGRKSTANGFRIQILLLDQRKWRKPKVWLKLKVKRKKRRKRRDEQNRR
jgi:hypothetical protein